MFVVFDYVWQDHGLVIMFFFLELLCRRCSLCSRLDFVHELPRWIVSFKGVLVRVSRVCVAMCAAVTADAGAAVVVVRKLFVLSYICSAFSTSVWMVVGCCALY